MKRMMAILAFAAGLALTAPAAAQQQPSYTPGNYMEVAGIYVEPGQGENYMDYLADNYRRSQDYARQQGWVTGYRIFFNVHRRDDEPHMYLITEFPRLATAQEQLERERMMNEHMRQTTRQAEEGSGRRVSMRRLGGTMLLQEAILRPRR